MKFAARNVNSLKVRQPLLLNWLVTTQADVHFMQKTKLEDALTTCLSVNYENSYPLPP